MMHSSLPFTCKLCIVTFFQKVLYSKGEEGTLVVQWLRSHVPNARRPGSMPGQETRPHMLQLKILHAATRTQCSQINKNKYFRKKDEGEQLYNSSSLVIKISFS